MNWLQRFTLVLALASLSLAVGCGDPSTRVPTPEEAATQPSLPPPEANNSSNATIPAE